MPAIPARRNQNPFVCRDLGPCSQPGIAGYKTKKLVKTARGASAFYTQTGKLTTEEVIIGTEELRPCSRQVRNAEATGQ
jgi:hypothetical protein